MAGAGGEKVFLSLPGQWLESRGENTNAGLAGIFAKLDDQSKIIYP